MAAIFDEQDTRGALSERSWEALRRLYEQVDAEPIQFGCLVCRPDPWEFDPELLAGEIIESRIDALVARKAEPTPEEIARWQAVHMGRAASDGVSGMYAVYGWQVSDDRGRVRILVTLHVDDGTFERVAGLFPSVEDAATSLQQFGQFEWLW